MKKILTSLSLIFLLFSLTSCEKNDKKNWEKNNIKTEKVVEKINLTSEEFQKELNSWEYKVIDLRTDWELKETWIIIWATQLDYYWPTFYDEIKLLDKNEKYLIYCAHWNRSKKVEAIMEKEWFNFKELNMWIVEWIDLWFETVSVQ